ncbi:hypothetical protein ABZ468_39905 [Streptomyces sp. NPDC005708]|uniref:hypothetical protein n=1 Tax=Streptomyces sp. NPDC005708 TaxID=3154564 RepID=UPI00340FC8B5
MGPEPLKGRGPHRYVFQLFALRAPVTCAAGGRPGEGRTTGRPRRCARPGSDARPPRRVVRALASRRTRARRRADALPPAQGVCGSPPAASTGGHQPPSMRCL